MSKKSFSKLFPKVGGPIRKPYVLQLFVAGMLPNSIRAISNIQAICEEHIQGLYDLEIIDIYQQPDLVVAEDLIAIPLLIKRLPLPEEILIGDMSDTTLVMRALGFGLE